MIDLNVQSKVDPTMHVWVDVRIKFFFIVTVKEKLIEIVLRVSIENYNLLNCISNWVVFFRQGTVELEIPVLPINQFIVKKGKILTNAFSKAQQKFFIK